jgi:hypothetical protein
LCLSQCLTVNKVLSLALALSCCYCARRSVHAFVSTQIPLASEESKDPSFAMESCLHLLDAILADCHARGHVALAAEEGEVGDTEVLERFMVW